MRLAAIANARRVTGLLRAQVGVDPATGKPTLPGGSTRRRWRASRPTTAGTGC